MEREVWRGRCGEGGAVRREGGVYLQCAREGSVGREVWRGRCGEGGM